MSRVPVEANKKKAPSLCWWSSEYCANIDIRRALRTMEYVIWSSTMKDVVTGLEHEWMCIGQAPLLGWCVRKCIEQHVNAVVDEGVLMKLVLHINFDVENELQLLQDEEVGGIRVAFLNCIQQWRHRDGEILLHSASDSLHILHNSCNRFTGARVNLCV